MFIWYGENMENRNSQVASGIGTWMASGSGTRMDGEDTQVIIESECSQVILDRGNG